MSTRNSYKKTVLKIGEQCTRLSDSYVFYSPIFPNKQATKPSIMENVYIGKSAYDSTVEPGDTFVTAGGRHFIVQIYNQWYEGGILVGGHLMLLKVNHTIDVLRVTLTPHVMGGINPASAHSAVYTGIHANVLEKGEALLHRAEADIANADYVVYIPDTYTVQIQDHILFHQYNNSGLNEVLAKIDTINVTDCPGILILELSKILES